MAAKKKAPDLVDVVGVINESVTGLSDIAKNHSQQLRDAATISDILHRRVQDLELSHKRLEAKVHGHSAGDNCTKCGAKYRGAAPAGQRGCTCGKVF